MPLLTLGFSTMTPKVQSLIDSLPKLDLATYEILIAVQGSQSKAMKVILPEGTRILRLDSLGLSRSRNAIIEHATGKYIWFLDDDIRLAPGAPNIIANWLIEHAYVDVLQVRIGSMECPKLPYKSYTNGELKRLNLLQISSIEMIVKTAFIKRHKLQFLEAIGLGTNFPACEENWFAIDLYDAGASFARLPQILVYHTTRATRWSPNRGVFFVRGAIAARFGILAPLLICRWWLRAPTRESILAMLRGMVTFRVRKAMTFT